MMISVRDLGMSAHRNKEFGSSEAIAPEEIVSGKEASGEGLLYCPHRLPDYPNIRDNRH